MVLHNKKIFQTAAKAYKQHVTQYKVFWSGDEWTAGDLQWWDGKKVYEGMTDRYRIWVLI